mmetsp:Transcript_45872/g.143710  ORF Transcript_45872/g.143710 Transcript_45872/m.143710 type:complete len:99 (-) Transcript_45872:255-551(-)
MPPNEESCAVIDLEAVHLRPVHVWLDGRERVEGPRVNLERHPCRYKMVERCPSHPARPEEALTFSTLREVVVSSQACERAAVVTTVDRMELPGFTSTI